MCTSPRSPDTPQRCYFISWLPNSRELIPAGADSVYIQRCSDKPYQPAQLKRSQCGRKSWLLLSVRRDFFPASFFFSKFFSPWVFALSKEQPKTPCW